MVNISKGGFPFAAAALVPALMTGFERDVLGRSTPCRFESREDQPMKGIFAEIIERSLAAS